LTTVPGETNLVNGKLFLSAGRVETKWGSATNAQLTAQWVHALTNPVPLSGSGQLLCEAAETQWGRGKTIRLNAHLASETASSPQRSPAGAEREKTAKNSIAVSH